MGIETMHLRTRNFRWIEVEVEPKQETDLGSKRRSLVGSQCIGRYCTCDLGDEISLGLAMFITVSVCENTVSFRIPGDPVENGGLVFRLYTVFKETYTVYM